MKTLAHERLGWVGLAAVLLASAAPGVARAPWTAPVLAQSVVGRFAVGPTAAHELRPADKAFLVQAHERLRQQMRLAQVGMSQAQDADVRSFALQLATDYRQLSAALEGVMRRQGGIADLPVGETSETYRQLIESGPAFDREFVAAAAAASQDVLALFEQAVSQTRHDDVRAFASAQLPTLRAHRNETVVLQARFE